MPEETEESGTAIPVQVAQVLLHFARERARSGDGKEACGLLAYEEATGWSVIEMDNETDEPYQFSMSPENLAVAHDMYGSTVVGCWHTHNRGNFLPSREDYKWAVKDFRYWIVTPSGVYEYDMQNHMLLNKWEVKL